jgi:hypothetical protein
MLTPLYYTHKPEKWLDFIKCMLVGYSLRKTTDIIGNVHYVTLFYLSWFHFLDNVNHHSDNTTVKKMMIESCLFPTNVTYDSIRLSNFSIRKLHCY